MLTMTMKKRQKLRNAEYYNLQEVFDKLYSDSKLGKKFQNLMSLILADKTYVLLTVILKRIVEVRQQEQIEEP